MTTIDKKLLLSERQQLVLQCVRMRLMDNEALVYLQAHGFTISRATYQRDKHKINATKFKRLAILARGGFEDEHLARIDICEMGQRELFLNYIRETNPFRRSIIMEKIIALQPYISSYYEATKTMMEENVDFRRKMVELTEEEEEKLRQDIINTNQNINNIVLDNGLQHKQQLLEPKKEGSDIPDTGGDTESKGEGKSIQEGEDFYRRQKARGIFFNPS